MIGTSNKVYAGDYLVYIAGVEVPVESVSVSYGAAMLPQAHIRMLPDETLYRLGAEDKVPVAIFYYDQWYGTNHAYRLLMDGDITGWSFHKATDGRAIAFTCVGHTAVMAQMYAMFLDSSNVYQLKNIMTATTASVRSVEHKQVFPVNLYMRGLGKLATDKKLERPSDFVANILNIMKLGGMPSNVPESKIGTDDYKDKERVSYDDESYEFSEELRASLDAIYGGDVLLPENLEKYVSGAMSLPMQFFVRYNHRVKMDKRWASTPLNKILDYAENAEQQEAFESKNEVLKALIKDMVLDHSRNQLKSNFGGTMSFIDIIRAFLNTIMYELIILPTAPYAAVNKYMSPVEKDSDTRMDDRLMNNIVKPQAYFAIPPIFNTIYPSTMTSYGYAEDYSSQNTRTYMSSSRLASYMGDGANVQSDGQVEIKNFSLTGAPSAIADASYLRSITAWKNDKNLLLYPEEFFKGPVLHTRQLPGWTDFLSKVSTKSSDINSDVDNEAARQYDNDDTRVRDVAKDELVAIELQSFDSFKEALAQSLTGGSLSYKKNGSYGKYSISNIALASSGYALCEEVLGAGFKWSSSTGEKDFLASEATQEAVFDDIVYEAVDYVKDNYSNKLNTQVKGTFLDLSAAVAIYHVAGSGAVDDFIQGKDTSTDIGSTSNIASAFARYDVIGNELTTPINIVSRKSKQLNNTVEEASRNIANVYAQYEHLAQKYTPRAGTASSPFNPYPVPGFPVMLLDNKSDLSLVAYLMGVTHTLSSTSGLHTTMQYTHTRTVKEMYEEVFTDITEVDTIPEEVITVAPRMPVQEVVDTLQLFSGASQFYKDVFYSDDNREAAKCAFNHEEVFNSTELPNEAGKTTRVPGTVDIDYWEKTNKRNVQMDITMKDTKSNNDKMSSYTKAMEHIARPICTLEEYITFIGGAGISKFNKYTSSGKVGTAYVQIKRYSPGPDCYIKPTNDASSGSLETSRRDWAARMLTYRKNVMNNKVME